MRGVWSWIFRYKGRFLWGGLMLVLTNAAAMAIPEIFRRAVDGITSGAPLANLQSLAVMLVALALGGALFRTLSRIHIFYAARDIELDLRCMFYQHLTTLEPAFFHSHPVGDLMSRATNDLTQVRVMMGPGILNIVNTVLAYGAAVPLMMLISPKLTLLTLAVYPPGFLIMRFVAKRMFTRMREQQAALGKISDFVQESLAGAHVVRAYALTDVKNTQIQALSKTYYTTSVRLTWIRSVMFRLVLSLGNLGILLAVFFGAKDALAGKLTLGDLVAMVEYMALLAWPTFALGWILSTWQRGKAAVSRMNDILDIAPRVVSGTEKAPRLIPSLETRSLSVTFGEQRILKDVRIAVPPGRVLGIVGPIGAGKTTLVQAFLRLLEVRSDQVFVGGYDVTTLDLATLRAAFGYVPQNHTLFSRSLRHNVAFGLPEADEEAIRQALFNAGFDNDLAMLPQGLDTPIGERGITLSGGQKQRVSMARALLLDPPILVLDDSLSSVDAETEAKILSRLRTLRSGKTTLIVAHRLSAVQQADEIVVLDQGRIVQRGKHSELSKADGWYQDIAKRQRMEEERSQAEVRSA